MRDRDLISTAAVIGVVVLLGLIEAVQGVSISFKDVDAAAWVQAVGSAGAIWAAVAIFREESRLKRADKAEERRARIEVRATLLHSVAELLTGLGQTQQRVLAIEAGQPLFPGDDLGQVREGLSRNVRPQLAAYAEAVSEWSMNEALSAREVQLIAACRSLVHTAQDDLVRFIEDPRRRPMDAMDFWFKGTAMRNLDGQPA